MVHVCAAGLLRGEVLLQALPCVVAAQVLDPQPGSRVLDLCASPGGKTSMLAQWMGDQGQVVALDRTHAKVGTAAGAGGSRHRQQAQALAHKQQCAAGTGAAMEAAVCRVSGVVTRTATSSMQWAPDRA
jgi:protein-L-isoaspartate O-methyltransferase